MLASLWHSVSHSEHNFARHAAEYRCVSSISGWSCSIFHFLRISLFQQYYNYFWNNHMEADCPKNLSLLFEEFYCRNVDAFGIVTLSTWCWNKLDVLYLMPHHCSEKTPLSACCTWGAPSGQMKNGGKSGEIFAWFCLTIHDTLSLYNMICCECRIPHWSAPENNLIWKSGFVPNSLCTIITPDGILSTLSATPCSRHGLLWNHYFNSTDAQCCMEIWTEATSAYGSCTSGNSTSSWWKRKWGPYCFYHFYSLGQC